MLWKRKKKEESYEEYRRFYRRAPGKKHALGVKLRRQAGGTVAGDLLDVSAGGAAVLFREDPRVPDQTPIVLAFNSLARSGEIVADARVASRASMDGGVRYGFEFTDLEALFAQIDLYYVKFFNRRRAVRVRPALDTKVTAQVMTMIGTLEGPLTDVSVDGFGVLFDVERAKALNGVTTFELQFVLPRAKEAIRWSARAIHLTAVPRGIVFGGAFQPQPTADLERQRGALAQYCASREEEMARWDTAFD